MTTVDAGAAEQVIDGSPTHDGVAHTYNSTGEAAQARHHWCQALALYTKLSVPDAEDVHAHLAGLVRSLGLSS